MSELQHVGSNPDLTDIEQGGLFVNLCDLSRVFGRFELEKFPRLPSSLLGRGPHRLVGAPPAELGRVEPAERCGRRSSRPPEWSNRVILININIYIVISFNTTSCGLCNNVFFIKCNLKDRRNASQTGIAAERDAWRTCLSLLCLCFMALIIQVSSFR